MAHSPQNQIGDAPMDDIAPRTLITDPARFEVLKNALTSAAEEM